MCSLKLNQIFSRLIGRSPPSETQSRLPTMSNTRATELGSGERENPWAAWGPLAPTCWGTILVTPSDLLPAPDTEDTTHMMATISHHLYPALIVKSIWRTNTSFIIPRGNLSRSILLPWNPGAFCHPVLTRKQVIFLTWSPESSGLMLT